MKNHVLFTEDFSGFPIGEFPYDRDHSAMGEYQYVTEAGDHGIWVDQVCNYTWNGTGPTWLITAQEGRHAVECMRLEKNRPHRMFPTLQTGRLSWRNVAFSATVRRLSLRGMAGLCFCMNHSIDTLVFSLEGRDRARLSYRHKEEVQVLAEVPFHSDSDSDYRLLADVDGSRVRCSVDGQVLIDLEVPLAKRGGKAALTADCPTRFCAVEARVTEAEAETLPLRLSDGVPPAQKSGRSHFF